jgi:hypothetical protein
MVMVRIEAFDAVAKRGTKMFEAAVLEGMIDVEALIVGPVVTVPMVIVDVGNAVDVAGRLAFGFRFGARLWPGRRRRRNASLVGARRILLALVAALRNCRQSQTESQSQWENKT